MGYSNNKWRKILTILMIINLCFILFAKFSKVFGSFTVDIPDTSSTLELPDFFKDYNFLVSIRFHSGYNKYSLKIALSSFDNKYYTNINSGTICVEKQDTIKYIAITAGNNSGFPDFNSMQTYFNSLTINSFTDFSVNAQGNTNVDFNSALIENGTIKYITNTNIYNGFAGIENNDIFYEKNASIFFAPSFDNVTEIENGYPDGVYISRGDYSKNDYLYFHLLQITYAVTINDGNDTAYYYSDKIFALNKDSKYFRLWESDPQDIQNLSYYSIPRYALTLDTDSSYLYVLSNSGSQISNSTNILEEDIDNGIYDVIQSDTSGIISAQDSINDKLQNLDDNLNDNTVSDDTNTDIENSLNFNNQNSGLNNLNNGFFSRLTTMLSNLLGYNLSEDTSITIPLPNSNKSLILHSKNIYDNVTGALRVIINAFWIYIFSFYMWKFINKIYIAVSTGNILDTFTSSGEAITNDML